MSPFAAFIGALAGSGLASLARAKRSRYYARVYLARMCRRHGVVNAREQFCFDCGEPCELIYVRKHRTGKLEDKR